MAHPPHLLLLLVPAPDTFPANRYNTQIAIQIPKAHPLLVEVLQVEAVAFSSHARVLHQI